MRRLAAVCCVGALLNGAVPLHADVARETEALHCANRLSLTAIWLNRRDQISDTEKKVMLGVAKRIVENHVPGTWPEQQAALAKVRDRSDIRDNLEDYRTIAVKCLLQFPIN